MEKKFGDPPSPLVMGSFFLKSGAQKPLKEPPQFSIFLKFYMPSAAVLSLIITTSANGRNFRHLEKNFKIFKVYQRC